MLGFVNSILDNLDEDKIRADWEDQQHRKNNARVHQENADAGVEEVLFAEDYQPAGRSSRANDAFRRAAE